MYQKTISPAVQLSIQDFVGFGFNLNFKQKPVFGQFLNGRGYQLQVEQL